MAEMRRPMDFLKSMALAQLFITVVYMFFGLFVYSYQGQFVVNVRSCARRTNTPTDTFLLARQSGYLPLQPPDCDERNFSHRRPYRGCSVW